MLVPALLICTVGVVGIVSLHHLKQASGRILSFNYHTIEETRIMEQNLRLVEKAVIGEISPSTDLFDSLVMHFEQSLLRCEQNITEKGEKAILQSIRNSWELLKSQFVLHQTDSSSRPKTALQITGSIYDQTERLVAINEAAMFSYEEQTRRSADLTLWGFGAALFLAIGTLTFFSLVSAQRISRPIVETSDRLHRALNPEEGRNSQKKHSGDEIELLRKELDELLGRLARHEDMQNRKLMHLQSRLAFVINEVLEGLALIDKDFNIITVNRIAGQILGVKSGIGKRLDQIEPREDVRSILKQFMNGTSQQERDLGELRFEIDSSERVYRPRVLTISGEASGIDGYLLLFWDVTEERRFEESRRKFISMLSHQLKTPMTSLSMSVNLLKEKLKDISPSHSELLSIATEDCSSLAGLISDLIEAAREPIPDLSLRLHHVNLSKLLRNGLRPLVSQAKEKGVSLIIPREQELKAWIDPVKFPWVITNIVGNALRYTKEGGSVEVVLSSGAGYFTVDVADTGAGIAQTDLKFIFEPYITLDRERKRGTHGLGLAIAKEIVEAHRGTIAVRSRLGEGTTFNVTVPFDLREHYEKDSYCR